MQPRTAGAVGEATSTTFPISPAATARALLAPGKGILAADESFGTIAKRFKALGLLSTEQSREAYREMLFSAPGLGEFISGAILFDESMRQASADWTPLVTILERQGIIPGVKVDMGTAALPNFPGEKITRGLDCLRDRLVGYRDLGARFTKWRAVFSVDHDLPSTGCLAANALNLALFATLSQEAGLVPIVEPEVLMDGTHSIERCEEAMNATLHTVFDALATQRVRLEEMLLKCAMVLPGAESLLQATDEEIATRTLRSLHRTVPAAVPGIVFLSGGQTPAQATSRLAAITHASPGPWVLTFSFGRALQEPALEAWHGRAENVPAAQSALLDCARQNSAAVQVHVA